MPSRIMKSAPHLSQLPLGHPCTGWANRRRQKNGEKCPFYHCCFVFGTLTGDGKRIWCPTKFGTLGNLLGKGRPCGNSGPWAWQNKSAQFRESYSVNDFKHIGKSSNMLKIHSLYVNSQYHLSRAILWLASRWCSFGGQRQATQLGGV